MYRSNLERILHTDPENCKNKLQCLKIVRNKNEKYKKVSFKDFPDTAHQAQLEYHQGFVQLDDKFQNHGAHEHLPYHLNIKI